VSNAITQVAQAKQRRDTLLDQNAAADDQITIREIQNDSFKKVTEKYGDDPNNPNAMNEFKEMQINSINKLKEKYKTNQGKNVFDRLQKRAVLLAEEKFDEWQNQKLKEKIVTNAEVNADRLSNMAVDDPSLNGALEALDDLDLQRETLKESLGDKNSESIDSNSRTRVLSNYITSNLVNGDLSGAKSLLKNERVKEGLGAEGVLRARKLIKAEEDRLKARQEKINKLKLSNKPWKFLDQVGETKNMELLDITRPESFIKRRAFVMDMEKKHKINMEGIPVHPAEVENLKNVFLKANENDLTTILGNLDNNVPNDIKMEFGKQLFPKEPALGAAINISGDDPEAALSILKGFKRIRSKSLEINNSAVETAIDDELKAFIDDNDSRNLMKEAIKAHAVEKAFNQGKSLKEDVADIDFIEESVNEILGPKIEGFGGFFGFGKSFGTVEGGIRGFRKSDGSFIEQDEFTDLYGKLTKENIKQYLREQPVNFDGEVIDLNEFQDQVSLETVGDGLYRVFETDTAMPLMNQNGEEFFLNLKEFYLNLEEDKK
jgi:hypothetical protein